MRLLMAVSTIGFAIELVGNRFVVLFEQVLVDAVVLVEQLQCGFETLGEAVDRSAIEAFVINPTYFEDDADLAALGQKHRRSDEPVEIDLPAERAGLVRSS